MVQLVEAPDDTECARYVGCRGAVRQERDVRAFGNEHYGRFAFIDDDGEVRAVRTSHCYAVSDKHRCLTFFRRGSRGGGKFVFECLDEDAPQELTHQLHRCR